ncbi:hypothetical protein P5G61_05925 [Paenibacillus sp. F6_3S_P_1C]|uniref:Helicase ATP-binding domain-containing protein n=1 Tax=Paenibacillus vandeheii TaxID=3035917 RepID=A0ABT8J6R9_9BACL|nr:DEAD/DEAH box helicase family protein [Paenibacillus vandeheii]MDN4600756.1 hypothetical protein [Paenibacillus vandeheii]
MTRRKRLTITDIIGHEVEQWQQGEIITIEAGTGVGKSYFIKNTLYEKAKREGTKILFLVNRKRLGEQFQHEIEKDNKTDVIDIYLYQYIEQALRKGNHSFSERYKYIACDEFHYFLSDSLFNSNTEDSFNMIMAHTDKTKIFMSATANAMMKYFISLGIEHRQYQVAPEYNSIRNLYFYQKDAIVDQFLEQIPSTHKAICFLKSSTRAYKLHKKFNNSLFVCAETGRSKYRRYVSKEKLKSMLISERFDERYLFTTTTLDNGINLKDKDIKYIVSDIEDIDLLIQCLGRKRSLDGHDKVTVIIKDISNKLLYRKKSEAEKLILPALYFKEHGSKEYANKYIRGKNDNEIVYDRMSPNEIGYEKVVNELRLHKVDYDIKIYEDMLNKENGYMNYIQTKLQQEDYKLLDETYQQSTLADYLDSIVGQRLYKLEQKQLIEKVNLKDGYNRLQKSCRLINEYFVANNIPFNIKDKNRDNRRKLDDGSENSYFTKTFWTVAKHTI